MARKRIKRKDLKQPDEFITLSNQVIVWVRNHAKLAAWSVVATILALAAVGVTTAFRAAGRRDANTDLGRAIALMRQGRAAEAASQFSAAAERWHGGFPGRAAALMDANVEISLDDRDSAKLALRQLWKEKSSLPPYLRQEALYVWGVLLESDESWPEAAAKYEAALNIRGPYRGAALLGRARTLEHAGEAEKAREAYRKYYDGFPDDPERETVRAKLDI